jgi:hypothetical protein
MDWEWCSGACSMEEGKVAQGEEKAIIIADHVRPGRELSHDSWRVQPISARRLQSPSGNHGATNNHQGAHFSAERCRRVQYLSRRHVQGRRSCRGRRATVPCSRCAYCIMPQHQNPVPRAFPKPLTLTRGAAVSGRLVQFPICCKQ